MKKRTERWLGFALLTVGITGVLVAVTMLPAATTPPVNFGSTVLARGTELASGELPFRRGTDVVVSMITQQVGGSSGWHSHPGGAIGVVQQGEITLYRSVEDHCRVTKYTQGQAFIERPRDVVNAVNTGSGEAIIYAMFPRVPVGGSSRIDVPADPGSCPGV